MGNAPTWRASAIITMTGFSADRSAWAIAALRRMWPSPINPGE
jgi:hypothetical protein